jgi:hypothetical protein
LYLLINKVKFTRAAQQFVNNRLLRIIAYACHFGYLRLRRCIVGDICHFLVVQTIYWYVEVDEFYSNLKKLQQQQHQKLHKSSFQFFILLSYDNFRFTEFKEHFGLEKHLLVIFHFDSSSQHFTDKSTYGKYNCCKPAGFMSFMLIFYLI